MKKNIYSLLLVLAAMAGITACSDDNDYQWASQPAGDQVYFNKDMASKFDISMKENTFSIPINRIKTADALTVNIAHTDTTGFYTVPATVTFNAGESVAQINITYQNEGMAYDKYVRDTLIITSVESTTPYGQTSFGFSAGAPSPYEAIGTGSITDNYWFEATAPVTIARNTENPNKYRLMGAFDALGKASGLTLDGNQNPYIELELLKPGDTFYDVTITLDGLVGYTQLNTGYYHSTYEADVYMLHPGNFTNKQSEDIFAYNYVVDYLEDGTPGRIQLAPYYYIFGLGGWNKTELDDIVIIDFPGYAPKDYSLEYDALGIFTDFQGVPYAAGVISLGEDATNVKAVVVSADADPEAVADAIAAGDLEASAIEEAGNVNVPIGDLTGKLQVVVVVLNEENVVKAMDVAEFEYYGGGANPWKSLGMGLFTDNLFITLFGPDEETTYDPDTYEVEIQENSDEPGVYRLVNAFQKNAAMLECAYTPTNFDINATDPEGVYALLQSTGCDDGGGDISVGTYGGYVVAAKGFDAAKEANYLGKLADGIITMPRFSSNDGSYEYQGVAGQAGSLFITGVDSDFKVVLPSAVNASTRAMMKSQAKANSFARRLHAYDKVDKKQLRRMMNHRAPITKDVLAR